ncbi:MAG: hypothetical protein ACREDF_04570 [Thermoplasmata archaeon]
MYLIGPENARMWTDTNRNFTLRYFLNSFRGFAVLDVRGHDDSRGT